MSSDPRFARLATDPRFIRPSKASQKVVLDDRFKDLLSTKKQAGGGNAAKVDKYGKKVSKNKAAEDLKAFYRVDEDGESKKGKGKAKPSIIDRARGEGLEESSDEEDAAEDGSEEEEEEEAASDEEEDDSESGEDDNVMLGSKKARAAAQKERKRRASSEISVDLDEDDLDDAAAGEAAASTSAQVEASIPTMEGSTRRVAIVNLDWDNVRAVDLFKVFDSVLSPSASALGGLGGSAAGVAGSRKSKTRIGRGRVESVKIYPSEFGKERMAREEMEGPPVEIFAKHRKNKAASAASLDPKAAAAAAKRRKKKRAQQGSDYESDEDSDDDLLQEDEGDEYDEVALRRYQLERLRYYYAVVEFDTAAAGQHAYEEIDGTEFEATANVLDLRYIPDETTFDDEPTETATPASVESQAYKPVDFVTDALRNSKVKLTWDADDPARAKLVRGTYDTVTTSGAKGKGGKKDEAAIDYSALLASDSEDDAEAARLRTRSAFGFSAEMGASGDEDGFGTGSDDGEGEVDKEMEITFGPALSGNRLAEDDDDGEDAELAGGERQETSLEKYERKDRERRLAKKEKRKAEKRKLAAGEGKKGRRLHGDDEDSDPDEAFDANRFEAGGADDDGADGFFDLDAGAADQKEAEEKEARVSKKAARQLERETQAKEAAALSLLVGDDDDAGGSGGEGGARGHFDMQAILRAEKTAGKPKKVLKKGKDRRKHQEAKELLEKEKDRFAVDTKDDRFKSLHEDHEFALDPSNPRYMKTKNMEKLLDESRKRRSDRPVESSGPASQSGASASGAADKSNGLSSLVESIKRKSSAAAGENSGKKQKKQKRA